MMLLQGFSLILTWSYALIFWLLVGAFCRRAATGR